MSLHGMVHFKDRYEGQIVQDKYFFVFAASNPRGQLKPRGETGRNVWVTRAEIEVSDRTHDGLLHIIDMAQTGQMSFAEEMFTVTEY